MNESQFIDRAFTNPNNSEVLERLSRLSLPDCWLVSGALFQSVWNDLTNRPPTYGIKDYDVFYFDDSDVSWEAEDRVIKHVAAAMADLKIDVEVRNQARVHLWYTDKFGGSYPALTHASESIDRFLATACMVGLKASAGNVTLYAPVGLDDLANLVVRPNDSANFAADKYDAKADRWKSMWPELTVLPAVGIPA